MSQDYPQTPTAASQSRKRSLSSFEEDSEGFAPSFSSQKRTKFEDNDEEHVLQPSTSQSKKFKPSNSAWPPRTPPRKYTSGTSNYSTPTHSQAFGVRLATVPANSYNFHIRYGQGQGLGPSASQETLLNTCGSNNEELTADSIADMLTRLSNTPQLVRKLERRRIAAEKSRDAKASKIASLEAEVERYAIGLLASSCSFRKIFQRINRSFGRLKAREKELEAVIAAYEQQG